MIESSTRREQGTSAAGVGRRSVSFRSSLSDAGLSALIGRSLLLLVAAVVGLLLLTRLAPVLARLFVAAILAAAMTPPVDAVASMIGDRRWAPPRTVVVLALYLVVVLMLAAIGTLVLGPVVTEARSFVERLPETAHVGVDWYRSSVAAPGPIRDLLAGADLGQPLSALAQQAPGVATQALGLVQYAVGAAFGALNALMVLILAVYLTIDAPRIRDYLVVFLPPERRGTVVRLSGEVARRLGGWARGQILLCAIIGAMSWVGLTVLGVPYALTLALLAGLMEAVPTIGPVISAIPALAVALSVSAWHGAAVLVLCTVIQQLENYLIVPRVMSRAVSVHPLVVLLALMAGAELLGPSGVVLAVPLAATLAVVVDELRRSRVASVAALTAPAETHGDGSRPPGGGPGFDPMPATGDGSTVGVSEGEYSTAGAVVRTVERPGGARRP